MMSRVDNLSAKREMWIRKDHFRDMILSLWLSRRVIGFSTVKN